MIKLKLPSSYGDKLLNPSKYKYLTVDDNGEVYVYTKIPFYKSEKKIWNNPANCNWRGLGTIKSWSPVFRTTIFEIEWVNE